MTDHLIQAGAELLDRAVPGWADRVDLDILDMRGTGDDGAGGRTLVPTDILGQLFGSWIDGCRALWPDMKFGQGIPARYGFDIAETGQDWRQLDEAWKVEIRNRRARTARR
jgi:hypothetical protein